MLYNIFSQHNFFRINSLCGTITFLKLNTLLIVAILIINTINFAWTFTLCKTKPKPYVKLITTFWETHSTTWTSFSNWPYTRRKRTGITHPLKGELDHIPVRFPTSGVRSHLTGFFIARTKSSYTSYICNRLIPHRALGDLTLSSSSRLPIDMLFPTYRHKFTFFYLENINF